jgi:DNA-binding response OmpR family regulator
MESGVSDYMIKPFKPSQLGFKVVQLLTKSKHKAKRIPVNLAKLEEPSKDEGEESSATNSDAITKEKAEQAESSVQESNIASDERIKKNGDDFDPNPVEVESLL